MSRAKAIAFLVIIAIAQFVFGQLKGLFDVDATFSNIAATLMIVVALLSLLSPQRSVVLYGFISLFLIAISTLVELASLDSFQARIAIAIGSLFVIGALWLWLRNVKKSVWTGAKAYARTQNDPWVALDNGIDPTIGPEKEGL